MPEFDEEIASAAGSSVSSPAASRRDFLKQATAAATVAAAVLATSGDVFGEGLEPATSEGSSLPEVSLLDEGGLIHNPPDAKTVAAWKSELRNPKLKDASRKARLHLLVGEYDLAVREMPEDAIRHFESALSLVPAESPLCGRAAFDRAFALYRNAEYRNAAAGFYSLLHHDKPLLSGFSRQHAAYWLRHTGACAAQHDALAKLGIPRPQKIDVLCAVAGLAISLKAHKLPSDKRLMKAVVRHTGRGSNAQDIVDACDKLRARGKADVKAHVLVADEEGLKALPMPVIAHVEHDHFVTVVKADAKGVSYVCVDCGEWPGGRVDLTWEQWRALEADAYVCVVKTGSEPDRVLARLLDPDAKPAQSASGGGVRFPGVRVAMNPFRPDQSLGSVVELSAMLRKLQGHVAAVPVASFVYCGYSQSGPSCPSGANCPMVCPGENTGGPATTQSSATTPVRRFPFPTKGDPVNLATLEEEYMPDPDLSVYNPTGPSVVWQRSYRSLRGYDVTYSYNDFGMGWSHSYNYAFYDPSPEAIPQASDEVWRGGSRVFPITGTGTLPPYYYWEVRRNGQVVGGLNFGPPVPANGWSCSINGGSGVTPTQITVNAPSTAALGTGYEVRIRIPSNPTGPVYTATFQVGESGFRPKTATPKYFVLPNGSRLTITCPTIASATTPTAECQVPPGQPYRVQTVWNAATNTADYVVTGKDQTRMVFTLAHFKSDRIVYSLQTLADRMGNTLAFRYQQNILSTSTGLPINTRPLLIGIDRVVNGTPLVLLTINRDTANTVTEPGYVTSVSDCYGRSVYYQSAVFNNGNVPASYKQSGRELTQVSQLVPTGTANPPMGYQFGYTNVLNGEGSETVPVLSSTTVPSPTGTGTDTATITYQGNTGFVTAVTDANGVRTEFTPVDSNGVPVALSGGPSGMYAAEGGMQFRDAHAASLGMDEVRYAADSNGNLGSGFTISTNLTRVRVKDPQGNVVYEYTANFDSNMSSKGLKDAAGSGFGTATYGSAINPLKPTQVKDGMNRIWSYTWDRYGNLLTSQTPRGLIRTYTYDYTQFPLGRLVSVQEGTKPATTVAYYEPSGLVSTVTSPAPAGSGVSTVQASATYTALGNLLTITSPGNNASTQTIVLSYTSDGAYTQTEMIKRPISVSDPLSKKNHFRYDSRGNLMSFTDASGNSTSHAYNLADQVLTTTLPGTAQTGAGSGRVTAEYQYIGGAQTLAKVYNESLALIGQVAYTYGKEGEFLSVTGNTPEPVAYTYDALYRNKTLTDANGNITNWEYNVKGYLSSILYPGGDSVSFPLYNNAGQATARTDSRGITASYAYSSLDGLVESITFAAPNSGQNVSYAYDYYGRLTTRMDASGTQQYVYDDLSEIAQVSTTYASLASKTVQYEYYPNGSRKTMVTPAGMFNYEYDAVGRLTCLTNPFSESTNWAYYANDRAQAQTAANGQSTTYNYNSLGQLTSLTNTAGSSTLPSFPTISYDGVGNLVGVTSTSHALTMLNGTTTYSYDSKDRLVNEASTRVGGYSNSYGYDGAGNLTNHAGQTRTYNNKNQRSDTGFAYDGNGNSTNYNGQAITWDVFDNPTQFGNVMTAGYTSEGLRAWKENSSTGQRTYFLYDGLVPICEMDSSGSVKSTNTFGVAGLESRRTNGGSVFYVWDERGSPSQRRDSAGTAISSHGFNVWGVPLTGTETALSTGDPYAGFQGHL